MRNVVVLLFLGLQCAGCATVARGTSEQLAFDSVPGGAQVRVVIDDVPPTAEDVKSEPTILECVTPCVLPIKRIQKIAVTIAKPGYQPENFAMVPQASDKGVATSVAGNLLLAGGVVGLLVDGASGASLDKCPNPVRVALRPTAPPPRGRGAPQGFSQGVGYDPAVACRQQLAATSGAAQPGAVAQEPAR